MATVYRGRHSTLNRDVAIKVLHPHLSSSTRNRMRFAREAKAVERLRHDNILEIFDYSGQDASECYIVTEFVEGETLTALLNRAGRLPSEVVAQIGIRVARALAFAHREGILHRDLKTDNVMMRVDGTIKLMDFGIARFLDESQVTMTGALVGSPAFMSPEQAREGNLDQRSDLFSLGTVLFYLVTGHLPFSGSNPSLILKNVIEGNRPSVSDLAPTMSASLADVVEQLLSLSREDRFNTAGDVEAALTACLEEVQLGVDDPEWTLARYLADPEDYDQRLEIHLRRALLEEGRRLLEQGDHLAALRLLNRLLSMDEDNDEVMQLVQSLHGQMGGTPRRGALVAGIALGVVVLGLAALWVLSSGGAPAEAPRAPGEPDLALSQAVVAEEPPSQVGPAAGPPPSPLPSAPSPTRRNARSDGPADIPPEPAGALPAPAPPAAAGPASPRILRARGEARPREASEVREAAEVEGEAAPRAEPETGLVVVQAAGGLSAEVYLRGTRVGWTNEKLKLPVGSHDLEIKSQFFHTHTEKNVVVSPGEPPRTVSVTLRARPVLVVFSPSWPADCSVRLTDSEHDSELKGTVGELGRKLPVHHPEQRVHIRLQCPDGRSRHAQWPHISGQIDFPEPPGVPGAGGTGAP